MYKHNRNGKPKILVMDIETAPILAYVWGLWENNVSLNQIKSDWHILSWAAKWLGDPPSKVMYMDQSKAKKMEDDSTILKGIWKLIDEADILLTQNGKAFDIKKLNARFILNGMKPPSSYKHIDTKLIAKKHFAFTSNKLEYMTDKLCTKFKKIKHEEFGGFELWTECLARNPKAWKEMRKYNIYDILSLEELYLKLQPWDSTVNFSVYTDKVNMRCNCGSRNFRKNGHHYLTTGKYQRFVCADCGAGHRSRVNEFSTKKKKSLRART